MEGTHGHGVVWWRAGTTGLWCRINQFCTIFTEKIAMRRHPGGVIISDATCISRNSDVTNVPLPECLAHLQGSWHQILWVLAELHQYHGYDNLVIWFLERFHEKMQRYYLYSKEDCLKVWVANSFIGLPDSNYMYLKGKWQKLCTFDMAFIQFTTDSIIVQPEFELESAPFAGIQLKS